MATVFTVIFGVVTLVGLSIFSYFLYKKEQVRLQQAFDLKVRQVKALEKLAENK